MFSNRYKMNVSQSDNSSGLLDTESDCNINREDLIIITVIVAILLLFLFLGNALIVWCVWKYPHMRSTAHYLIANLSMSNNTLCLYIILESVHLFVNLTQEQEKCICLFKLAFLVVSFLGSECNMLLLSVERFIAVLYPLKHKVMFLKTKLGYILILCWILYFLFAFLPVMGWNALSQDKANCDFRTIWELPYFSILCGLVILGFVVNMFLFVKVLYTIQCTRIQRQTVRRNRKTMWISFCILFGFIICWGPVICGIFIRAILSDTMSKNSDAHNWDRERTSELDGLWTMQCQV